MCKFSLLFIWKTDIYVNIHTLHIVVNEINSTRKRKEFAISVQMTYILEIKTDNHLHCTVKM